MRLSLSVHAASGIGDRQHDIGSGAGPNPWIDIGLMQFDIGSFCSKLTGIGHGVSGINDQVHHDLFDLRGVRFHPS